MKRTISLNEVQTLLSSRRAFAILFALWFWLSRNDGFAANQAIISYSSRSYAFLPAQVAVAQNFFRDENLEPLLIQMRSQVTVPALISEWLVLTSTAPGRTSGSGTSTTRTSPPLMATCSTLDLLERAKNPATEGARGARPDHSATMPLASDRSPPVRQRQEQAHPHVARSHQGPLGRRAARP